MSETRCFACRAGLRWPCRCQPKERKNMKRLIVGLVAGTLIGAAPALALEGMPGVDIWWQRDTPANGHLYVTPVSVRGQVVPCVVYQQGFSPALDCLPELARPER